MTRIHWLITSPRLPGGLLSAAAWDVVRSGVTVYSAAEGPQVQALREASVDVHIVTAEAAVDRLIREGGVWLAGPDGDPAMARKISTELAAGSTGLELELLYGSWDPPGARLLDAVAVIDRLRSPGGCPWDADQTHESLAPFLLEEAYETVDAISSGDPVHLREELGDLLIQPLLHARFASEDSDTGFDIDDVAGDAVAKLIRRHPHVFGDEQVTDLEDLGELWEAAKREEKPERRYATDGVATGQPALSLAAKYLSRVDRAGLDVPVGGVSGSTPAALEGEPGAGETTPPATAPATTGDISNPAGDETVGNETAGAREIGQALLTLVSKAHRAGIDPELALRRAALDFAADARRIQDAGNVADTGDIQTAG